MSYDDSRLKLKTAVPAVLAAGSLWGLSEVVLDEAVRSAGLPLRAAILVGAGALLAGVLLGVARRASSLFFLPVVAVLMKQLTVPILGASVMCGANSCLAVLLEGSFMAGAAALFTRKNARPLSTGFGVGAAIVGSAVPFYFIGLSLAPCAYLRSFAGTAGLGRFMLVEALPWGAFAAALFPLGLVLGHQAARLFSSSGERTSVVATVSSLSVTVLCWTVAAAFISQGIR